MKDLAPITQIVATPNLLVVPANSPAKSVASWSRTCGAHPGSTYGSAGVGTSQHLAGELLRTIAGVDIQHVPYRGIAAVMPDLLAGRLTMAFGNVAVVLPLVREGKLRALAGECGAPLGCRAGRADHDRGRVCGLRLQFVVRPDGTGRNAAAIIERLHRETVRILGVPQVRKRFDDLGMDVVGNTPAQFADVIRTETPFWTKVIKDAGIKAVE